MLKLFLYISIIILTSENSYAYLDPGTGGSILQILIAMFAAVASIITYYWNKVKFFFLKLFKKDNDKNISKKENKSQ
jgi:hypothetical protein